MEDITQTVRKQRKNRSRRRKIIIAIIALIILIVVVVPLAVVLPRITRLKGESSSILLPLYIYPLGSAWDPLYEALGKTSSVNFTVILNPDSGPGSNANPGADYVTAIQKLNTYSHVRTVGYVRTNYSTRAIDDVLADVATYSGWPSNTTGLEVHGIFFDECPHEYSASIAEYLETINAAVKNATGIATDRVVIHNPGTVPDARLNSNTTDITVAFEETYTKFDSDVSALGDLPLDRSRYSFMVNAVPSSKSKLRRLLLRASKDAQWLFATSNSENYYESFASDWNAFVKSLPTS